MRLVTCRSFHIQRFIVIIVLVISTMTANAFEREEKKAITHTTDHLMVISPVIESLVVNINEYKANKTLQNKNERDKLRDVIYRYRENLQEKNIAEHFLLTTLEAELAFLEKSYPEVIALLKPLDDIDNDISEKQISSDVFNQRWWLLALSYEQLKEFDLAYTSKKKYVNSYFANFQFNKQQTILENQEKYQLARKLRENELLAKQSEIKRLKIAEIETLEAEKERNIIFLVCVCLIFFFMIVRQMKIRKKLQWYAQTDSLTGLLNRGSLFSEGEKLFAEAIQDKRALCIILLDIDHFKKINDQFGHDVGDKALQLVASLGKEVMRSRDILTRLGGEEFVAVLPEAKLDEAKAIAVRYRDKIAQSDALKQYDGCQLTASFGVACIGQLNDNNAINNFEALLHCADNAMYQAKSAGRNQVKSFK